MSIYKKMPEHSSKKFTWCKEDNTFSAEASDFGDEPIAGRSMSFIMVSERTGNKKQFVITNTDYDNEGDVLAWKFVEVGPAGDGIRVIIFND